MVQARIMKSSLRTAMKTPVLASVKLFPKFERGHSDRVLNERGVQKIGDFEPVSRRISETVQYRA